MRLAINQGERVGLGIVLLLVALCGVTLFSIVHAADPNRIFMPDSASYVNPAKALLYTGRFAIRPDNTDIPEITRTPGYPLFLAGLFWIFGQTCVPVILIQILLNLGTIAITYHLGAKLWGGRIGLVGAVLLACDIPSFISAQKVLSDTLFTFLLWLAVSKGIDLFYQPDRLLLKLFICGVLLAFATLVRPVLYYAIVVALATLMIVWKVYWDRPWKKIFTFLVVMLIPWFGLVGGWHLRNFLSTGSLTFSTIQSSSLLFYRAADVIARRDGIPLEEAQRRLGYQNYRALHPETSTWTETQLHRRWKDEGLKIILDHPGLFLKGQIWGLAKLLFGPGESALVAHAGLGEKNTGPEVDLLKMSLREFTEKWVLRRPTWFGLFVYSQSYLLIVYIGVGMALWLLIDIRKQASWDYVRSKTIKGSNLFIWGITLYLLLISAGPEAYSRFRVPLMPFFCLYGGYGLYQFASYIFNKSNHAAS